MPKEAVVDSDKKKVLVVDDDPDTLRLLSLRLREHGYEIETAADGIGCMSKVVGCNPDLLILDLGLPCGDGFITLDRLKNNARHAQLPVIVLTAQDTSEAKTRALAQGADMFFEKSIGRDEFLSAVDRLVSR